MRVFSILGVLSLVAACTNTHCHRKSEVDQVVNPVSAEAPRPVESDTSVFIYKYDGSLQCQTGKAISIEKMAVELKGIPILSQQKKKDGLMHIQVCGSATGTANVFEIPQKFLSQAEKLGFKKWSFE